METAVFLSKIISFANPLPFPICPLSTEGIILFFIEEDIKELSKLDLTSLFMNVKLAITKTREIIIIRPVGTRHCLVPSKLRFFAINIKIKETDKEIARTIQAGIKSIIAKRISDTAMSAKTKYLTNAFLFSER